MALVQISDIIVPEIFAGYVVVESTALSAFVQSGVIVDDPALSAFLAGGGRNFDLPFWNDVADTLANISTDVAFDYSGASPPNADPESITTGQQIVQRHNRNQAWSAADLTSALAGSDPISVITALVAGYWMRQEQLQLIASVQGLIADSVANDASDMVNVISLPAGGTPDATNLFSAEAVIDTVQTMGDHGANLAAISMHSVVFTRAKKNNLIDFIPDSENTAAAAIPFYNGMRVIVDDGMPAVANTGNVDYSTYLFGAGAVRRGVGSPRVPAEVERQALAGQGGGQEFLISRIESALHPTGTQWTASSMALESPTNAELALAANWDKVVDRKLITIAELRTNG